MLAGRGSRAERAVPSALSPLRRARDLIIRHLHFVGPGLVSSVAYIDPGNWATDLQAGASYGYQLLFVVLVAGLAAVVLQLLAVRLGAVTSLSLAAQTRLLFLRLEAKYPRYRILLRMGLYALYGLAEIAIIGTDLAELLGSAIALNLLFPRLPLFAGVLITAADVLIVLVFFRSNNGRRGMLLFEVVIVSLVIAVLVSFVILLHLVKPDWKDVFNGLVPSATLVQPGALYIGIGIIGATVMPHALFLGSSLASVDRLNMVPLPPSAPVRRSFRMPNMLSFARPRTLSQRRSSGTPSPDRCREDGAAARSELELAAVSSDSSLQTIDDTSIPAGPTVIHRRSQDTMANSVDKDLESMCGVDSAAGISGQSSDLMMKPELDKTQEEYEKQLREFDRIKWVDVHLLHSTIDTSLSLLGFALTINAAILTLAGAAYCYNDTGSASDDSSLQGAYNLIQVYLGNAPAIIFALALLCAGQSASITATLAGQVVSEGFIQWKTSPSARRLVTRLIGVIPAAIVAAALGEQGLNTMLVASQVLLSIVLPFVVFPLVYLCSRGDVMSVDGPEVESAGTQLIGGGEPPTHTLPGPSDPPHRPMPTPVSPRLGCLTPSTSFAGAMLQPLEQSDVSRREGSPESPPRSATIADGDVRRERGGQRARRRKSYVSPKWLTGIGYLLFAVICVANVYVIVELCLGNS